MSKVVKLNIEIPMPTKSADNITDLPCVNYAEMIVLARWCLCHHTSSVCEEDWVDCNHHEFFFTVYSFSRSLSVLKLMVLCK